MFKCNRDIVDLIDLLSAVENEAEAFGRLVKGQIEILACGRKNHLLGRGLNTSGLTTAKAYRLSIGRFSRLPRQLD